MGLTLVLACALGFMLTGDLRLLLLAPLCGYGFAWVGHFVFEKNRPATFTYPAYSLMGDWVVFADVLRGRLPF